MTMKHRGRFTRPHLVRYRTAYEQGYTVQVLRSSCGVWTGLHVTAPGCRAWSLVLRKCAR